MSDEIIEDGAGTTQCPICPKAGPHYHPPEEIAWHRFNAGRWRNIATVELNMWLAGYRFALRETAPVLQPKVETGWLIENSDGGTSWWGRTPDGEDVFGWTAVVATEHQWIEQRPAAQAS